MTNQEIFYYPNQMGRIILLAYGEVLGQNSLQNVLKQAQLSHYIENYPPENLEPGFSFEDFSRLQDTLEQIYGPRGGRGLALRAGRATFKYGLKIFGPMLGFTDLAFRLAPIENKLRTGMEFFAEVFNRFTDQRVRVEVLQDQIFWHIDRCPICWNRQSDVPVCHLAVGLLQEALYWVSGGKIFRVEETACISKGDSACCIRIEKQALE